MESKESLDPQGPECQGRRSGVSAVPSGAPGMRAGTWRGQSGRLDGPHQQRRAGKPADGCSCSVCSAVLGWVQTLLCGVRWQGALPGSGLWLAVKDALEKHLGGEINMAH